MPHLHRDPITGRARIVDGTDGVGRAVDNEFDTVASIVAAADLQDTSLYFVRGYNTADDGGGGWFRFVDSDTTTADEGVIVTTTGVAGRAFRQGVSGFVEPIWWGTKGVGFDDTVALQAAYDYAKANSLALKTTTSVCPRDHVWCPGEVDLEWEGKGEWVWDEHFNNNCTYYLTPTWTGSRPYEVGDRTENDGGKVYNCTTGGTSAASGGPTGTGSGIADGSVVWDYDASPGAIYKNTYAVTFGATDHLSNSGALDTYSGTIRNARLRCTVNARLQNCFLFADFDSVLVEGGEWDFSSQDATIRNENRPRFCLSSNNATWHSGGATKNDIHFANCTGTGTAKDFGSGGSGNEGFSITSATNVSFTSCKAIGCGDDGMALHSCDWVAIIGCELETYNPRYIVENSTRVIIDGCRQKFKQDLDGAWGGGSHLYYLNLQNGSREETRHVTITNCVSEIPSALSTACSGVVIEGAKDVLFANNVVINNSLSEQLVWVDINKGTMPGDPLNEDGDGTAKPKRIKVVNNRAEGPGYSVIIARGTSTADSPGPITIEGNTASRFESNLPFSVMSGNKTSPTMRAWEANYATGYEIGEYVVHEKVNYERTAAKAVPEPGTFGAGDWSNLGSAFEDVGEESYDANVLFYGNVVAAGFGTDHTLETAGGMLSFSTERSGRLQGVRIRCKNATITGTVSPRATINGTQVINPTPVTVTEVAQLVGFRTAAGLEFASSDKLGVDIEERTSYAGTEDFEVELLILYDD